MHQWIRRIARRFQLSSIKDDGTESYAAVEGYDNESFTDVMRIQQHGFSSHPPADSHMVGIALNGETDGLVLLGGEHGTYRPKNLPAGASMQYSTGSAKVLCNGDTITLSVNGVSLVISSSGITVTGGTIKHDGKSIDKSHIHSDVSPGPADTGPPAN